MKKTQRITGLMLIAFALFAFASCSKTASDHAEDAADSAEAGVETVAENTEDAIKDAAGAVEDAAENAVAKVGEWKADFDTWLLEGTGLKSIELRNITGEGELTADGKAELDLVAAILEANPELKAEIQGHSPNRGKPVVEKTGSVARAAWTKTKLVLGRDALGKNLSVKGYGSERPLEGIDPTDDRNKRVTIQFTK